MYFLLYQQETDEEEEEEEEEEVESWRWWWYVVDDDEAKWGHVLLGLLRLFLFRNRNNRIHRISVPNKTDRALFWKQNSWRDQEIPVQTLNFPAEILFRPFCYREQNEQNSVPFIPE